MPLLTINRQQFLGGQPVIPAVGTPVYLATIPSIRVGLMA